MSKEWVQGRHCEFKADVGEVKAGTKAWVYKVSKESVCFLTKQDQELPLKEVSLSSDDAEKFVAVKPGKPRDNFTVLFEDPTASGGSPSKKKAAPPKADPGVDALIKATLEKMAERSAS